MTLVIGRRALLTLLEPGSCLDALRAGFLSCESCESSESSESSESGLPSSESASGHSSSESAHSSPVSSRDPSDTSPDVDAGPGVAQRVTVPLPFPGVATALIPGLLPGVDAYTVKVNAKFPAASPALRGVICLHSGADGELLALLDSATITAWRTGLAAALATHTLAAPDGRRLGVIGAGAQAELVLAGLRHLRPAERSGGAAPASLLVHDIDPARAESFAAAHGGTVVPSPAAVSAGSDIVVTATWSRTPLLDVSDVRPGQHLTTLGADEPGKLDLSPALLASAALVVDDLRLARASGVLTDPRLRATPLADRLRATPPPARPDSPPTVYAPVGLPWQDLALSWLAYRRALAADLGTEIDLLA